MFHWLMSPYVLIQLEDLMYLIYGIRLQLTRDHEFLVWLIADSNVKI
jgi:hypothetical protein